MEFSVDYWSHLGQVGEYTKLNMKNIIPPEAEPVSREPIN